MTESAEGFAVASRFINLASAALGAKAIAASDEFFGAKERLLQDEAPVFISGKYDENGKWMDGWESRRRRGPGHDSCIVRLAASGTLHAIDVDTTHFTGNYPHAASIDAALTETDLPGETAWKQIVAPQTLQASRHHLIKIKDRGPWSHLRLNIYPDGGIARLRAYGMPDALPAPDEDGLVNLASALSGAHAVAWNDAHFGKPQHLLLPGVGARMEDGWETRRRREPGNDWTIIALGRPGTIERVEIDT
ncbi:MAG: allantoicase, partial [Rhodomicrobium sp.]